MKRKLSVLLLAVLVLAAAALPAFADIMWEPYGNSFYESHRDDMKYVDRGYLANGEKGYVTILSSPDSLIEVGNLENGTRFNVGMTWQAKNGTEWAVGYYAFRTEKGWDSYEGWVPMSDLALIYDYQEFASDYSGEFGEYDGSGDHLTEVCLYSYPNGRYEATLTESKSYMAFADSFTHLYTDEAGRRWTYVGYYMGRYNAWACIDDPLNENLGTDGYLSADQVRGVTDDLIPAKEAPEAKTWVVWAVPAALIVVLAGVTAVIIRRKRKKAA